MGGSTFENLGKGNTAQEVFSKLRENALYEYGHRGYTGTIAEKDSFVIIAEPKCSTVEEARTLSSKLIDEGDDRIDDKWGPAGCIPLPDNTYFFFGWASS